MLSTLISALVWAPQKEIFRIGFLNDHPIVWYGLLFASGFVMGQQIMFRIYQKEGLPSRDIERMTVYMVVATVVGARLGHCLFYDPSYYLSNPIEILKVWEGGLASHGGAIGIITALWLYSRSEKTKKQSFLFVLDRIVIVVALGGACIRMGNFVNNEMLGIETNSSAGVVFLTKEEDEMERMNQIIESVQATNRQGQDLAPGRVPVAFEVTFARGTEEGDARNVMNLVEGYLKAQEKEYTKNAYLPTDQPANFTLAQSNGIYTATMDAYGVVRHPAQVYEALYCLLLFVGLLWLWAYKRHKLREGFLFSLFVIILFTLRILDEFLKLNQEPWEEDVILNAGQFLSIPLILVGIGVLIYIHKKPTPLNPENPIIPESVASKKK